MRGKDNYSEKLQMYLPDNHIFSQWIVAQKEAICSPNILRDDAGNSYRSGDVVDAEGCGVELTSK